MADRDDGAETRLNNLAACFLIVDESVGGGNRCVKKLIICSYEYGIYTTSNVDILYQRQSFKIPSYPLYQSVSYCMHSYQHQPIFLLPNIPISPGSDKDARKAPTPVSHT